MPTGLNQAHDIIKGKFGQASRTERTVGDGFAPEFTWGSLLYVPNGKREPGFFRSLLLRRFHGNYCSRGRISVGNQSRRFVLIIGGPDPDYHAQLRIADGWKKMTFRGRVTDYPNHTEEEGVWNWHNGDNQRFTDWVQRCTDYPSKNSARPWQLTRQAFHYLVP